MFGVFHWLIALRIQRILELVYVPAIRLFQKYKTTNANTVTASNGPTMKHHSVVVLSEKTKNKKKKQNKKLISDYGSTKNDPKQNKVVFCCGFIVLIRLSSTENNNSFKKTCTIAHHVTCGILLWQ